MGKNKLSRWAEMETFDNVVQPPFEDIFQKDHRLKGKWKKLFFKNDNPIILELGCGKGEYTVGLARKYPDINFLGVDIKGARMWKGAGAANREGLKNAGFLRTRIELIEAFFAKNEVDEIWITFPDPQLKKRRIKKRLTGARFLNKYNTFLKEDGLIHLKTDSVDLYNFTNELLNYNDLNIKISTNDLYSSDDLEDILSIRTFYETMFIEEGKKITYTCFSLIPGKPVMEMPENE